MLELRSAIRTLIPITLLAIAAEAPAQVYSSADGARLHATRAELEQVLANYESAFHAPGMREDERMQARVSAALIRTRLEEGDFQPGDQIMLMLDGHPTLSETYTVDPAIEIVIPTIGSIPLRGVLRSELQEHLAHQLGRYIREPRVRAQSTIRIVVAGAVGNPGFYSVPSTALITDVLSTAGGTGSASRLTRIRIERNGSRIIAGRPLQDAIIAGRSLDQLNIRAGDHIIVPGTTDFRGRTEMLRWGVSLLSAGLLIHRIFF